MSWGIVCTVKAPLEAIERFAAYHLELGAKRILLYLDDDNPQAYESLRHHPALRVFQTHAEHWRSQTRPSKHQTRQAANARHAYRRHAGGLSWLAHIDVDEFLMPLHTPLSRQLAALPEACWAARVRPVEALWHPHEHYFKAMTNARKQRQQETEEIYPTFGAHLNGGFLSHVAGKLFVRTGALKAGAEKVDYRIHNVFIDGAENPGQHELSGTELCHLHATSFEHWMAHYRYRLAHGVYRAELKPNRPHAEGGLTLNELLNTLEQSDGIDGLKAFYEEVCAATPALLHRLEAHGLLRHYDLALESARQKHFPTA
ncbi:glycosyltransferase family 2 protein [uncultured Lentibacter sp.]|uniref:glycosyltransferase family 2 protein n=1 Tax=uncultured Lentibacter sp. TaxID=1659309 RepID=UPI002638A4FE|nr:glycosyltransferase family 2 protein [uncultured Lentibacter sp.]